MKAMWSFCLIFLLFLLCSGEAVALELAERLAHFPKWEKISSAQPAVRDLVYPDWMAGSSEVRSTLVDLVAPLAPDIVTFRPKIQITLPLVLAQLPFIAIAWNFSHFDAEPSLRLLISINWKFFHLFPCA